MQVMGTVSDVLHRLGTRGAAAQSLGVAINARSFFDDVSAPKRRQGAPTCAPPVIIPVLKGRGTPAAVHLSWGGRQGPGGGVDTWVCTWDTWAEPGRVAARWRSSPSPQGWTNSTLHPPALRSSPSRFVPCSQLLFPFTGELEG